MEVGGNNRLKSCVDFPSSQACNSEQLVEDFTCVGLGLRYLAQELPRKRVPARRPGSGDAAAREGDGDPEASWKQPSSRRNAHKGVGRSPTCLRYVLSHGETRPSSRGRITKADGTPTGVGRARADRTIRLGPQLL